MSAKFNCGHWARIRQSFLNSLVSGSFQKNLCKIEFKSLFPYRLLHLTPNCQRYQINYDQLRDGSLANLASHDKDLLKKQHDSVVKNVKNVQGFQRGAERGFTSVYTDCIHVLTAAVAKDVPDLAIWFRKVNML